MTLLVIQLRFIRSNHFDWFWDYLLSGIGESSYQNGLLFSNDLTKFRRSEIDRKREGEGERGLTMLSGFASFLPFFFVNF